LVVRVEGVDAPLHHSFYLPGQDARVLKGGDVGPFQPKGGELAFLGFDEVVAADRSSQITEWDPDAPVFELFQLKWGH